MASMQNIITLGARLVFRVGTALSSINKVSRAFQSLQKKARRLREGFSSIATGLRQLSMAGLAVAAGFVIAGNSAAKFEQAMSGVHAILLDATAAEMMQLEALAKQLGRTTVFTATQAATAMQLLARAGFKVSDTLEALPAILNAAAAEGIDLATATSIVASNVRAFSMRASEAAHVADVLALASANSNTTMVSLGESLKFAAPFAARLGIGFEETAAALGLLGDAGLRGTIAGTALKNMMIKLSKPSDEIVKLFGGRQGFAEAVLKSKDQLKPLPELIGSVAEVLNRSGTILDKAGRANKLFGIRGEAAFALLARAGSLVNTEFVDMLKHSSEMKDEFGQEVGAAAIMAQRRLDNLKGTMILFKSALEGFFIEFYGPILPPLTEFLGVIVQKFQDIVAVMQILNDPRMELNAEGVQRYGTFVVALSQGIIDAANLFGMLINKVQGFTERLFEFVNGLSSGFVRWGLFSVVVLGALSVAGSILGGAFIALTIILGAFSAIIAGVAAILSVITFKIVLLTLAVLVLAGVVFAGLIVVLVALFESMRREGETTLELVTRLFMKFGEVIKWTFQTIIQPFFEGFIEGVLPGITTSIRALKVVFTNFRRHLGEVFVSLGMNGKTFAATMRIVGIIVGAIIGGLIAMMSALILMTMILIDSIVIMVGLLEYVPFVREGVAVGKASIQGEKFEIERDRILGTTVDLDALDNKRSSSALAGTVLDGASDGKDRALDKLLEAANSLSDGINVQTDITIDKKNVASAVGRSNQDAIERGGGSQTPWQRRQAIEGSVVMFTVD